MQREEHSPITKFALVVVIFLFLFVMYQNVIHPILISPHYDRMEPVEALAAQFAVYERTAVLTAEQVGSEENLSPIFHRLYREHPELFWMNGTGQWSQVTIGSRKQYELTFGYRGNAADVEAEDKAMKQVAEQILTEARKKGSDYDKALYVHDWLVLNCVYDVHALGMYNSWQEAARRDFAYTPYGCLVNRTAVCDGYSKTFQYPLHELGITCDYVGGTGITRTGSGPHSWNRVVLDGKTVMVDVTWDDPIGNSFTSGSVSHDYFAVSPDKFAKDHIEDPEQ